MSPITGGALLGDRLRVDFNVMDEAVYYRSLAISGEDYEVKSMYPDFIQAAQGEKETKAIQSMHFALEAEKTHSKMYGKAKEAVKSGKDTKVGVIYVCEVCGHTVEDHAPDTCPVCNARKEKFRKF